MTCPKCGKQAKETNVYGRDTDETKRRYICEDCEIAIITKERIDISGRITKREK